MDLLLDKVNNHSLRLLKNISKIEYKLNQTPNSIEELEKLNQFMDMVPLEFDKF